MTVSPKQTERITDIPGAERAIRRVDLRIDAQRRLGIGECVFWAGESSSAPGELVPMVGQGLLVADWPELYAVVGNKYGGDATKFYLADTRGHGIPGVADAVFVRGR